MPRDDDGDEAPREWSAVPRAFFAGEVRSVLAPLMPNAREPVAGQDDEMFDLRQMRIVIRYGDATDEAPHHFSLPVAIATLLEYGRHARLYRFDESEPGVAVMEVMFGKNGRAAVLFSSRCLDVAEQLVGSGSFDEEEEE